MKGAARAEAGTEAGARAGTEAGAGAGESLPRLVSERGRRWAVLGGVEGASDSDSGEDWISLSRAC